MNTPATFQYLEPNPKSTYRQLFIKGTRIRSELVYAAHVNAEIPMTPDEVAADYGLPLLTLVRPHGGRKTCHPADIRKLLGVLEL